MNQWTVDCSKYLTIEEIIRYFTRIVKHVIKGHCCLRKGITVTLYQRVPMGRLNFHV